MFIIIQSKISPYFPCDFFFDHELNNTFIFSSFLKNSLNRYRFLSWEFFSFNTLKMSLHCLLGAVLLNCLHFHIDLLYGICLFPFYINLIFFTTSFQQFDYDEIICVCVFFYSIFLDIFKHLGPVAWYFPSYLEIL